MVRRLRGLVVMSLLLPVMASGVAWTLAIEGLGHGAHHVSFHAASGRLTIVLEHDPSAAGYSHDHPLGSDVAHVPAATHSHSSDHDHVVAFSAPDPWSTTTPQYLQNNGGAAIVLATATASANVHASMISCAAYSRVGPPAPPSRSSILRI